MAVETLRSGSRTLASQVQSKPPMVQGKILAVTGNLDPSLSARPGKFAIIKDIWACRRPDPVAGDPVMGSATADSLGFPGCR